MGTFHRRQFTGRGPMLLRIHGPGAHATTDSRAGGPRYYGFTGRGPMLLSTPKEIAGARVNTDTFALLEVFGDLDLQPGFECGGFGAAGG